jgi:RimJ/RimL family protein N-acetyltransferase
VSARPLEARLEPRTLAGRHVRLEPLGDEHFEALWRIAQERELWRWTSNLVETRDDLRAYVDAAYADARAGRALPFATIERAGAQVVGSTRFGNYEASHRRVEIGWTFVGAAWQRTAVNTEAKLLMLAHAFDELGLERVELKTDALNERSRRAIARLGAVEEGTLRHQMLTYSGRWRDTVYSSVLRDEWPRVRARLESALDARA